MELQNNVFKFIDGKSKNRRIQIVSFLDDKGEFSVMIKTKRLVDFKQRHIITTEMFYSYYTFRLMYDFIGIFFNDPEFNKATNRMTKEIENNRMSAKSNLKYP